MPSLPRAEVFGLEAETMCERKEGPYAIEDGEQRVIHYADSLADAARWLVYDKTLQVWDLAQDRRVTAEALALLRSGHDWPLLDV